MNGDEHEKMDRERQAERDRRGLDVPSGGSRGVYTDLPEDDTPGHIHAPETMFFRLEVGTAESKDGQYEMSLNIGGSHPIVRSTVTGQWYTISWRDIVNLARKKGIDNPLKDGQ